MTLDATEVVGFLTLGIHDAGVYFPGHARVQSTAATLAARFAALLDEAQAPSLFLGVVDGRLVHDGKFLLGPTLIAKRLIDAAVRLHCGGFVFRRGITPAELIEFFAVCSASRTNCESLEEARRLLTARGVCGIGVSPPFGSPGWMGERVEAGAAIEDPMELEVVRSLGGAIPAYQRLREAVETAHASAGGSRDVDVGSSRATVSNLAEAMGARPADVLHLSRYPDYASYTVGHSVRVALLALLVGQHLGLDERLLVEIGTAGLLHDVGKSRIPHDVLFKRGRLDDEERKVISTHTTLGAGILIETEDAPPLGIAAAFGHHLRHDRRGYPAFPAWALSGRVTALVQVCDVFEALTAVRPYKPSLTPRRAYEIMLGDRGAFDPSALAAFVAAVGFFPPGGRLRLKSGEEAFVLRVGRDPARPVVELTRDAQGRPLPAAERVVVDLAAQQRGEVRVIDEVILDDVMLAAPPAQAEALYTAGPRAPLPKPPVCCHDAGHEHAQSPAAHEHA